MILGIVVVFDIIFSGVGVDRVSMMCFVCCWGGGGVFICSLFSGSFCSSFLLLFLFFFVDCWCWFGIEVCVGGRVGRVGCGEGREC